MYGKALSYREAKRILNNNGFFLERYSGDHAIFKNGSEDVVVVAVGKAFSQKTWKRECKRVGIKEY